MVVYFTEDVSLRTRGDLRTLLLASLGSNCAVSFSIRGQLWCRSCACWKSSPFWHDSDGKWRLYESSRSLSSPGQSRFYSISTSSIVEFIKCFLITSISSGNFYRLGNVWTLSPVQWLRKKADKVSWYPHVQQSWIYAPYSEPWGGKWCISEPFHRRVHQLLWNLYMTLNMRYSAWSGRLHNQFYSLFLSGFSHCSFLENWRDKYELNMSCELPLLWRSVMMGFAWRHLQFGPGFLNVCRPTRVRCMP